MKYTILVVLIMLAALMNAQGYDQWNFPRFSGELENGSLKIRCEASQQSYLLYNDDAGVQEVLMTQQSDTPQSWEGEAPAPVDSDAYYGFKITGNEFNYVLPVYYPLGDIPSVTKLTKFGDDDPDDSVLDGDNLEIVAEYGTFSNEHLIVAIENAGGGFPVSEGWEFYSYSVGVLNPDDPETYPIFALVYSVEQPGMFEPGLYKITGDSGLNDMNLIGDVEIDIDSDNNMLILSCNWEDLLDDSDFVSWFDLENPEILLGSTTAIVSITQGIQTADYGRGANFYPRAFSIDPFNSTPPQLTDIHLIQEADQTYIELQYDDNEENFPIVAQVETQGETRQFLPMSLNYSETVTYRSENVSDLMSGNSFDGTIRFSDDLIQYTTEYLVGVDGMEEHMEGIQCTQLMPNTPNPFNPDTEIRYYLVQASDINLSIFNNKGQLIRNLDSGFRNAGIHSVSWDGLDRSGHSVATGVYLYILRTDTENIVRKMLLLK